jgi:hypothetical protein
LAGAEMFSKVKKRFICTTPKFRENYQLYENIVNYIKENQRLELCDLIKILCNRFNLIISIEFNCRTWDDYVTTKVIFYHKPLHFQSEYNFIDIVGDVYFNQDDWGYNHFNYRMEKRKSIIEKINRNSK